MTNWLLWLTIWPFKPTVLDIWICTLIISQNTTMLVNDNSTITIYPPANNHIDGLKMDPLIENVFPMKKNGDFPASHVS